MRKLRRQFALKDLDVEANDLEPALEIAGMSKSFGHTQALDSVNLHVSKGEIRALLGANGSGKSTLIKILSGFHRPDDWQLARVAGQNIDFDSPKFAERLGIRFVHQDLGLIDSCSVLDNIEFVDGFPCRFGTIRGSESRRKAKVALGLVGLEIDVTTLVRDLTASQKTGVAVARALSGGTEGVHLLVFDEPTATLPSAEVEHLLEMVRSVSRQGVGVLYVTHRLEEVFGFAKAATVLRNGREIITTPLETLTRHDLFNYLVGRDFDDSQSKSELVSETNANPVLEVDGLSTQQLHDVRLSVQSGEVVGISGVTGSGREELLPAIFGVISRNGSVRIGGELIPSMRPNFSVRKGAGFVSADRKGSGGMMNLSIRENFSITGLREFWQWPKIRKRAEAKAASEWLGRLQALDPTNTEGTLATLSGGNQQKVILAKWLRMAPKVLMLDEPTQGVDVGAKAEIHREILATAEGGAAVLVSSIDIDELVRLCHRVIVLRNGRIASDLRDVDLTATNISRETLLSESVMDLPAERIPA